MVENQKVQIDVGQVVKSSIKIYLKVVAVTLVLVAVAVFFMLS